MIRKLISLGFSGPVSGGKHQFMIKGEKKLRIPNPHGNKDIAICLIKEILRQAEISHTEWDSI
ncbi:MAG: type II toxin-antitoxin system HicA family toxin [Nitrospirae bacterium]|nr:type II toxin-antitoxin system HicA family toxin [Nitrospirota bacterium]MBF0592687.1 type II toxin-antitoxin system HicA family toxin [Nitrospirota bacterium]